MLQLPESKYILERMRSGLSSELTYHSIDHTLAVFNQCKILAESEGISPSELRLLLVAALYHDAGYLFIATGHEDVSCDIVAGNLPNFGYTNSDVATICSLIMATKIPQHPESHLAEILCDADLDYLGKSDYFVYADKLYQEMKSHGDVSDRIAWNKMQLEFLNAHHYFTKSAILARNEQKAENIKQLQSITTL